MIYLELARRQKGWSQQTLGDHPKVRIHQSFISQIERGTGLPAQDQINRLARVLGVAPDMLLATVPEGTPVPEDSFITAPERG
jgi:ribosome-binding protein aMBF1 (putative translation factor)